MFTLANFTNVQTHMEGTDKKDNKILLYVSYLLMLSKHKKGPPYPARLKKSPTIIIMIIIAVKLPPQIYTHIAHPKSFLYYVRLL